MSSWLCAELSQPPRTRPEVTCHRHHFMVSRGKDAFEIFYYRLSEFVGRAESLDPPDVRARYAGIPPATRRKTGARVSHDATRSNGTTSPFIGFISSSGSRPCSSRSSSSSSLKSGPSTPVRFHSVRTVFLERCPWPNRRIELWPAPQTFQRASAINTTININ